MVLGCLHPRLVFNKYLNKHVQVPCGRCFACRCLKANEWTVRLQMESKVHKYCIFGTLTYQDEFLPRVDLTKLGYVSDTFERSCESSKDFIAYHKSHIPVCDSKDFSNFMKRLRQLISNPKYGIPESERHVRFFAVSEYGPTTYRPHFHYLLWFDSACLASYIKEFIYKAWQCKNPHSTFSSFNRRNRTEFLKRRGESYVANYLASNVDLPPVLLELPFRSKHTQSLAPSIGELYLSRDQVQRLSDGSIDKITFSKNDGSKACSISPWRSFESRLFPKCYGFSRITTRHRIALYSVPAAVAKTYKQFKIWLFSRWHHVAGSAFLIKEVISFRKDSVDLSWSNIENTLRKIYFTSRAFLNRIRLEKKDVFSFVREIENYFIRRDYRNLVSQISYQESLSNMPDGQLKYYPCLIDSGFFNNERKIPFPHYEEIARSFGIDPSRSTFDMERSFDFMRSFDIFSLIFRSNSKTRKRKDFVSLNPQFARMYTTNLFNLRL